MLARLGRPLPLPTRPPTGRRIPHRCVAAPPSADCALSVCPPWYTLTHLLVALLTYWYRFPRPTDLPLSITPAHP
eukprot:5497391-Prymnesium_polylepis.1